MRSYRVLTGPTASGKTDWLLQRAERVPIRVISADSRQVYRHMDIGTGKPSAAELARVPHYGLGRIEPSESFSAHDFMLLCAQAFAELDHFAGEVWVCGGTGLYIRALVDRLPLGAPPRPALREALWPLLRQRGSANVATDLHLLLPEPSNPVRVIRAAEKLADEEGQRIYSYAGLDPQLAQTDLQHETAEYDRALADTSQWRCEGIYILDPGDALEGRIAQRVTAMFDRGLVAEVSNLRSLGYGEEEVVSHGIAYKEAGQLLDGELGTAEAIERAIIRTRQYAKRQRTYFRGHGWHTPLLDNL